MRPAILCGLEREAARRYRAWAVALSEHAKVLVACASREEEIADSVDGLFSIDAAGQEAVDKALPEAIAISNEVFVPYPMLHQLYLQSEAELQGAAAWANIAEGIEDADILQTLLSIGCETGEGFHFSHPMPAVEFEEEWIARFDRARAEFA